MGLLEGDQVGLLEDMAAIVALAMVATATALGIIPVALARASQIVTLNA